MRPNTPEDRQIVIRSGFLPFLLAVSILVLLGPRPGDAGQSASNATFPLSGGEKQDESLKEVNKQLTNPISNIWSLTLKQNNYLLDNPHAWNSELLFEPVLPVALTRDWNLVTRPVFKLFDSKPYMNSEGNSSSQNWVGRLDSYNVVVTELPELAVWAGTDLSPADGYYATDRTGQVGSRASGCVRLPLRKLPSGPLSPTVVVVCRAERSFGHEQAPTSVFCILFCGRRLVCGNVTHYPCQLGGFLRAETDLSRRVGSQQGGEGLRGAGKVRSPGAVHGHSTGQLRTGMEHPVSNYPAPPEADPGDPLLNQGPLKPPALKCHFIPSMSTKCRHTQLVYATSPQWE